MKNNVNKKCMNWLHNNAISNTTKNLISVFLIFKEFVNTVHQSMHCYFFSINMNNNENHRLGQKFLPSRQHAFWQSSWLLTWVSDRYLGSWSFFIWSTLTHWLFRVSVTSQWLAIARLMVAVTANMTPFSDVMMLNAVLAFD